MYYDFLVKHINNRKEEINTSFLFLKINTLWEVIPVTVLERTRCPQR